jgi:hypothetical protein
MPGTLSRDLKLRKLEKKRVTGFRKQEVLVVAHGSGHNATIVTVDTRK